MARCEAEKSVLCELANSVRIDDPESALGMTSGRQLEDPAQRVLELICPNRLRKAKDDESGIAAGTKAKWVCEVDVERYENAALDPANLRERGVCG